MENSRIGAQFTLRRFAAMSVAAETGWNGF
jgi:hypothetical protein